MAESGDTVRAFSNSTHTSVKTNLYALAKRLCKQENFTEILLSTSVSKSIWYIHVLTAGATEGGSQGHAAPMPGRPLGKTGILLKRINLEVCSVGASSGAMSASPQSDLSQTRDLKRHSENHKGLGTSDYLLSGNVECVCVCVSHSTLSSLSPSKLF